MGHFPPTGGMGPVQKQQVGNAEINGDGDERSAKAQNEDGDGVEQKGIDEKSCGSAHQRGQKRQHTQKGPGKGEEEQKGDAQGGEQKGQLHIVADDLLVVEGGAVGAHHGQPRLQVLRLAGSQQLAFRLCKKAGELAGLLGIRTRQQGAGKHQQVPAIGAQKAAPVELRLQGRGQRSQPGQNQLPQVQRIRGSQPGLTDALHAVEGTGKGLHAPGHGPGFQPGSDIPLQFLFSQQKRQALRQVAEQFGHGSAQLPVAHLAEKAAGPHARLELLAQGNELVGRRPGQGDIHRHLVVHRMAGEDLQGIAHHPLLGGHGADDVGVDVQPLQGGQGQARSQEQ